ncbi:MAG: hypothetical protein K2M97_05615 [Muribaculaceae bacterium]|nr:hypothetical protein [Muribaculaceae bacterium]
MRLNRAYEAFVAHPASAEAQMEFLDAFPDDWMTYLNTYGFDDSRNSLYLQLSKHSQALRDGLTLVADSIYCTKLLSLTDGATDWVDDTSAELQATLCVSLESPRGEAMLQHIVKLSRAKQLMFWQFYWSNTLPKQSGNKRFAELATRMANAGLAAEVAVMGEAFANFWGKTSFHGFGFVGGRPYEGKDF